MKTTWFWPCSPCISQKRYCFTNQFQKLFSAVPVFHFIKNKWGGLHGAVHGAVYLCVWIYRQYCRHAPQQRSCLAGGVSVPNWSDSKTVPGSPLSPKKKSGPAWQWTVTLNVDSLKSPLARQSKDGFWIHQESSFLMTISSDPSCNMWYNRRFGPVTLVSSGTPCNPDHPSYGRKTIPTKHYPSSFPYGTSTA